jgi:hypothetical protein
MGVAGACHSPKEEHPLDLKTSDILSAVRKRRRAVTPIDVPEWGGVVYARRLTPDEAEQVGLAEGTRDAGIIARTLAVALCDADGEPLFTDPEPLKEIDIELASRLFIDCLRVCGLSDEKLEEAVADFDDAQSGSSSSV